MFNDFCFQISSCVDYLLSSRKASPNSMYDDGNTVLHRAANGGYIEVTEMLLHHEAKVSRCKQTKHTSRQLQISVITEVVFSQTNIVKPTNNLRPD